MKFDFITIGGSTEDITVYTNEGIVIDNPGDILQQKLIAFEFGAKLKVERAYSTFGGGASNAAVNLSKLGFRVAALVALGQDERGGRIIKNFRSFGVDTTLVQQIKNEISGFSFLLVGQGNEHVVFSNRAANQKLSIKQKEKQALKKCQWIYMTSLSGNWRSVLKEVFSQGRAKIAWNPGHIQLHAGFKAIGGYLSRTAVLTVNKDEAIELVVTNPKYSKKDRRFLNNTKNLLKVLKDCGPEIVLVTNGKHGADAYDGRDYYHQDIIKERKRIDTTGVGDAFGSTFTAGLELFKGDIAKALYIGAKNTASVISWQGAQNGLLGRRTLINSLPKRLK